MTPALKPIETAKNALLVVVVKKAIADPIPVAKPAAKVTVNASISSGAICYQSSAKKTGQLSYPVFLILAC